jgi:hypothetical protein
MFVFDWYWRKAGRRRWWWRFWMARAFFTNSRGKEFPLNLIAPGPPAKIGLDPRGGAKGWHPERRLAI